MLHLTPQGDGKALHGGLKRPAMFRHIPCEADIAHAIRGFGQLAQEPTRRFERAVHVPQRAGSAEPCKLQPCGAVAFGDRTRLIDPHKEERHALGAGPL